MKRECISTQHCHFDGLISDLKDKSNLNIKYRVWYQDTCLCLLILFQNDIGRYIEEAI